LAGRLEWPLGQLGRYPSQGARKLKTRTYSIIWCVTYYLVIATVAACQPFILSLDSTADILSGVVTALPPTYWLVNDAKRRRAPVPHVIQPGLISLWILVVPIYLLWTRKWWGLLYLLLHVVCTTLVSLFAYQVTVYLIWPMVFPGSGG